MAEDLRNEQPEHGETILLREEVVRLRAEHERLERECKPFKACHCSLSSECHVIQDQPCEICEGPVDATPEVVEAMFRGYEAQLTAARAEGERMRNLLVWLDKRGGLGLDVHDLIRATLTGASEKESAETKAAYGAMATILGRMRDVDKEEDNG